MKLSRLFVAGLATVSLLAASCSNDKDENSSKANTGEEAALRISIVGESDGTYSTGSSKATGTTPDENSVKKFSVYIFNSENQTLETSETVTNSTSTVISGLSTGFPKDIVVVANTPSTFPTFQEGDSYEKFQQAAAAINLNYQSPVNVATNGLVMVGQTESPVTLQSSGITQVEISMRRLVAKVKLGSITVIPLGENDIDLFEVTGVSIQRALASTDIFGNPINHNSMFGGLLGSWNNPVQSFLYDAISPELEVGIVENFDNYFYVLPNEMADSCTLLTLVSTYNGDEQYFPIKINATQGDKNTDGTYITSNKTYIINIIVNNLNEGTTDPDVPPTTASMEVTLTVELHGIWI